MKRTLMRTMFTDTTVNASRSHRILMDVAAGMAWFHGKHPDRFHGALSPYEIAIMDDETAAVIIFGNLSCNEGQMLAGGGEQVCNVSILLKS